MKLKCYTNITAASLLVALFLLHPDFLSAQQDCALKLREAQEVFAAGQIERVPDLLKTCLESGFTREEKQLAYKLIINAYIFDDNFPSADSYMKEFLKKFPDYRPSSADPANFIRLIEEFDNHPRYNIGFSGGLNLSDIRVIEYYGIHDLNSVIGRYSHAGFGFQYGFLFSKVFGQNFETGFEPRFMQLRYDYKVTPFPFCFVEYNETQNSLLLPLTLSLTLTNRTLNPYLKTGIAARMLLSAKSNTNRNYINTGNLMINDIKGPETDIMEKRNRFNYFTSLGGGIKYKIPAGYFFIDASYNYSLVNDVVEATRQPANDDLSLIYYYVDNDFRANFITLSLGFSYSFYKPKKL